MARLELTAHELALVAWFVEAAVVSLKEALEEKEEQEGVEDALRVRDLYTLEGLRGSLQAGTTSGGGEDGAVLELDGEQLDRLGHLARDAVTLCRGGRPDSELAEMETPADAAALADTMAGLRDKVRAHPDYTGDTSH